MFLNQEVLNYIQSTPNGIEKAAFVLSNFTESLLAGDAVIDRIMELASITTEESLHL